MDRRKQACFHCWPAVFMIFSYLPHTVFGFSSCIPGTLFVIVSVRFIQLFPKQIPLVFLILPSCALILLLVCISWGA